MLLLWLWICVSSALLAACGGGGDSGSAGGGRGGSGGGTGSANLAVDANPLRAAAVPDTDGAVEQPVPLAGGQLVATGADGTVYPLAVPADALLEPTTIRMTPLAGLVPPDLAAHTPRGVRREPAGTQFARPLPLAIAPPAGA